MRRSATLPFPNDTGGGGRPARFVVVANPEHRRVAFFQAALARFGLPPAAVVSYVDLLTGRDTLERVVRPGTVVRIESPGQNFEVERLLLAAGDGVADGDAATRIRRADALRLDFDKGRILYPRQWYLGFRATLRRLARQLAGCPEHRLMNRPEAIGRMFDKPACQELFARRGLPVPAPLGPVGSFEELRQRLRDTGRRRVFIKLAHGSSASGVVAYATDGRRQKAYTTVEVSGTPAEPRLYNSRRVRCYQKPAVIARLLDALCREGVQVEEWVPKAGLDGHRFDLRVVVIAGRVRQVVVRMSRNPMTNLHLLNRRGTPDAVRARMGPAAWESAVATCRQAAAAFPSCLYAGVDLAIAAGFRRHAVLEINAFGDLLPGVLCDGMDTYSLEVAAVRAEVGT